MRTTADRYKIILACGDQITAKNPPLNFKSVYGCEAGKGHGYNVKWVSMVTPAGFTRENPTIPAQPTGEDK